MATGYLGRVFWVFLLIAYVTAGSSSDDSDDEYEVHRIRYNRPENATGNITFGAPLTLTGDQESWINMSSSIRNSLDMWLWWVNEIHGGIKVGDEVYFADFAYIDNKGKTGQTKKVTEYLIETEGAQFLYGPYTSRMTKRAQDVAEKYGILMMGASASADYLYSETQKYLFSPLTASLTMFFPAIKSLVLRGAETFIRLDGRDFAFCEEVDVFIEQLAETTNKDLRLLFDYNWDTINPSAEQIGAMFDNLTSTVTEHVDVAIACLDFDACVNFIKQSKEYNFAPDAMVYSICVDNANYIPELGVDDGRYILGAVQWHEDMPVVDETTGWSAKEFSDIYRSRYSNSSPPYQAASYFAAGIAYLRAIENAGSLNSDDVAYALSRLDIETFYGALTFDSKNQNSAEFSYVQYNEEGVLRIVMPDAVATGSMIYPMPSWSYRDCVAEYGENSCKCSDEGCPRCTLEDYNYTLTECIATEERRWAVFALMTNCENGTALPDPFELLCDHVPTESSTAVLVQALAYLSFGMGLCFLVWTIIFRKADVVKASQPTFCYLIAIGGMVCAISPVTNLGPNTNLQCQIRPWIFHIPFILMIGSLFVKTYRVWRIFGNVRLSKVKVTLSDSLKLLGILMSVPLMVLLVWFITSPPLAVDGYISITNVGNIATTTCQSSDTFGTVLVVYEVGLILMSCYFSFKNRNVGSAFSETRYLVFAVYSIALIVFITSLVAAMDVPISVEILMRGLGASLSCAISLCTIFIPKVIMLLALPERPVFNSAPTLGAVNARIQDCMFVERKRTKEKMIRVCEKKEAEIELSSSSTHHSDGKISKLLGIIDALNKKLPLEERIFAESDSAPTNCALPQL